MVTAIVDKIGVLNIELRQGDTRPIFLTFNQTPPSGGSEPMDLTGFTAIRLDVKTRKDIAEAPFVSWQIGNGLTISGSDNNILSFQFNAEFTRTAAPGWFYDIKFTRPSGIMHLIEGTITVQPVATK
jgi:hypothetical protein